MLQDPEAAAGPAAGGDQTALVGADQEAVPHGGRRQHGHHHGDGGRRLYRHDDRHWAVSDRTGRGGVLYQV